VEVEIGAFSPNFIDAKILFQTVSSWSTFVYGAPQVEDRQKVWDDISALAAGRDEAWLLSSDFNEFLDNSKKRGGPVRPEGSFIPFRSFVSQNGLWDVSHSGNMFSWRGHRHSHFIHSRLDRALANVTWSETFSDGRCRYLRFEGSDHRPLLIYFDPTKTRGKGVFRFDRQLRGKEEIRDLISDAWQAQERESLFSKFSRCRRYLIQWTKDQMEAKVKVIKEKQAELEKELSALVPNSSCIESITGFLASAYKEEEALWRQRSRIQWL